VTWVIAGLVTLLLTVLLTIAGVGAAFVLIPVFLALGIDVHTAMATALLLNAVAMSVASVNFVRRKLVVWAVALPMMVSASLVSPLGAWASQGLDRVTLLWLFVAFLTFAAAMMLWYTPRPREASGHRRAVLAVGTTVGALAGFIGGLLGVGGGNIIVPALVALGFDPKKASASTAFVVIFSSLTGFLGHVSLAGMNAPLMAWTAAGSASGALIGSWLMTEKLKGRQVKVLIGVVLLGIAVRMAWSLL
jgi:uncharacterized membrane protein YfcA